MKEYTLGLLFDEKTERVVLIRKNRPNWQIGFLNGLGGKIEEGETPRQAMEREFFEEAGVTINTWVQFGEIVDLDNRVYLFYAKGDISDVRTMTDEDITILPVSLNNEVLPSLKYIVPMAIWAMNYDFYANIRI